MRRAAATLVAAPILLVTPAMTASAAPAASPALASPTAATGAVSTAPAAIALPTGERNPKVSRSLTGVRASAYVGKYYSSRYEGVRKCIVRRESGGNYRIVSRSGTYRGAYQFNPSLARATARKMGRSDLVGRSMNTWSRFDQDKAFWIVWNHGRGAGNWGHAC